MKNLNNEHGYGHLCPLCPWIAHTSSLNTCYSESCNSLLIIILFKVTELRKRAVKEQKVSIEVPKREPPAAKGILCFD